MQFRWPMDELINSIEGDARLKGRDARAFVDLSSGKTIKSDRPHLPRRVGQSEHLEKGRPARLAGCRFRRVRDQVDVLPLGRWSGDQLHMSVRSHGLDKVSVAVKLWMSRLPDVDDLSAGDEVPVEDVAVMRV